jgi:hypothetical protein
MLLLNNSDGMSIIPTSTNELGVQIGRLIGNYEFYTKGHIVDIEIVHYKDGDRRLNIRTEGEGFVFGI